MSDLLTILNNVWDSVNGGLGVTLQTRLDSTNDSIAALGNVAHDGVDAGAPAKVGFQATSQGPAAVSTNADRVNSIADMQGRQFNRGGHQPSATDYFAQAHLPAANTQATKTQASPGTGKRNVVTWIVCRLVANTTAPAAVVATLNVIDGASGGGTFLARFPMTLQAVAGYGDQAFMLSNLWLPGTAATATTVEFGAGAGANTFEFVQFGGCIIFGE